MTAMDYTCLENRGYLRVLDVIDLPQDDVVEDDPSSGNGTHSIEAREFTNARGKLESLLEVLVQSKGIQELRGLWDANVLLWSWGRGSRLSGLLRNGHNRLLLAFIIE